MFMRLVYLLFISIWLVVGVFGWVGCAGSWRCDEVWCDGVFFGVCWGYWCLHRLGSCCLVCLGLGLGVLWVWVWVLG